LRRLFGALLLASSVVLIAAGAAPSPQPSAAPLVTPTPVPTAPPLQQQPTLLIFPFDVQTGVDSKIGTAIAQILAQEMTNAGGVTILPVPQGVARKDFLDTARTQHADFYISGYVTPVGDSASVVEQVVSVDSGVILFSQTAQVASVGEVASQAELARAEILQFVGRTTQNVETQGNSTPAPTSTNGANVKLQGIGGIVDSVFRHKGGATPTPAPVVKPQRGMIVTPIVATGTLPVPPSDVAAANSELSAALGRRYTISASNVSTNVQQAADSICGANRDNTIAASTIAETVPKHGRKQYTVTFTAYTCFGAAFDKETGTAETIRAAVNAAVTAYAAAHPGNS
jgi:hypothetical protein